MTFLIPKMSFFTRNDIFDQKKRRLRQAASWREMVLSIFDEKRAPAATGQSEENGFSKQKYPILSYPTPSHQKSSKNHQKIIISLKK